MEKGLMIKDFRKKVLEKKSEVADPQFFLSKQCKAYLEALIEAICKLYNNKIKLHLLWTEDDCVAYATDRYELTVNVNNCFFQKAGSRVDKLVSVKGIVLHECGHLLFTDFKLIKSAVSAMTENKKLFPNPKCEGYDIWEQDMQTVSSQKLAAWVKVWKRLQNSIEDGFIEYKILETIPGEGQCLYPVRNMQYAEISSYKEMADSDLDVCSIFFNLILGLAKYGKVKIEQDDTDKPVIKALLSCYDTVRKAVKTEKSYDRMKLINQVFIQFYLFIREENEKRQQQNNQPGDSSNQETNENGDGESSDDGNSKSSSEDNADGKPEQPKGKSEETGNGQDETEDNSSSDNNDSEDGGEENEQEGKNNPSGNENTEDASDDKSGENESNSNSTNGSEDDNSKGSNGSESTETGKNGNETSKGNSDSKGSNDSADASSSPSQSSMDDFDPSSLLDNAPSEMNDRIDTDSGSVLNDKNIPQKNEESKSSTMDDMLSEMNEDEQTAQVPSPQDMRTSDSIEEEIARDEVMKEQEDNLAEELQDEADNTDFGQINKNISVNITRRYPTDQAYRTFESDYAEIRFLVNKTVSEIRNKIKDQQQGGKLNGLYMGRYLDQNSLYRFDQRVLCKNDLPEDIPDMALCILIDSSGSMSGYKEQQARKTALLLYLFGQALHIPVMVYGHNCSGGVVGMKAYADFGSVDGKDKYRICDLSSSGCNRDGMALRFCSQKLANRPEQNKFLIMISDGLPSAYRDNKEASDDIRDCLMTYSKKNVRYITFGLGNEQQRIQKLYTQDLSPNVAAKFCKTDDPASLPKELVRCIKSLIKTH